MWTYFFWAGVVDNCFSPVSAACFETGPIVFDTLVFGFSKTP